MTRTVVEPVGFVLRDLPRGEGDPAALTTDASGDWLPAVVPGGVHESLLAAGRIADPRRGGHERAADWIEERDWWFRARLTAPAHAAGDRVRLVCEGLDTVADVWLDGVLLGHHENQFRPAEFDVTDRVRPGAEHVLLVRFAPPLPPGADPAASGPEGPLQLVTGLRKAAFSWGWDFAPRVPSVGIWRPVRLSVERGAVLAGHHVAVTDLVTGPGARAVVQVLAEVEQIGDAPTGDAPIGGGPVDAVVTTTLTAPDGRSWRGEALVSGGRAVVELEVPEPALWWTHDLGEPALHDARIELRAGGEILDVVEDRVGLRTITVDRSPDPEGGRLFRFVLNGVPLFARGANWVPPSPFVGSVEPATYRDRVLRAREGNLTMLRVWGGGVYEHEAFYAACDELGVLVWQDFMFACVDYPGESAAFRAEVAAEAEYQVGRLRSHPCLALWCGNNEVEIIHALRGGVGDYGERIFHEVLPAAVARHDGRVAYWPGSPWDDSTVNGQHDGDRHDWEVWHGLVVPGMTTGADTYPTPGDARHYRRYADDHTRFASEFGVLAAPDRGTLERWLPGVGLHDAVFDRHVTDRPADKGNELFAVTTGVPADLDEYVALSQAVQAEAMGFAIEHFRRRQPATAGALVWQFDDTWPAMTWSLVDADGVPKAAYYAVKRASAPVVVSFRAVGGSVELWLVSNARRRVWVTIDIEIGTFTGGESRRERVTAVAEPGTSVVVWTGEVPQDAAHYVWASRRRSTPGGSCVDAARAAWAAHPGDPFPPARLHFAELGELELGEGKVEVTEVLPDGLELLAHGYCYGVRISHPVPGMRLDDNGFDLRAGERRRVRVSGVDPAALTVAATVPRARRPR